MHFSECIPIYIHNSILSFSLSVYIAKKTENLHSHKNVNTNVYSSVIYNSQKNRKQPTCP